MHRIILSLSLISLVASSAEAYHLDEHEAVTRQAFAEIRKCRPEVDQFFVEDDLVQANLDEDLNLIVKELFYSHFYNPNRHLEMFRASSMDRVVDLMPELRQCRGHAAEEVTNQLGSVIHHLQDGTVPAHVVPVNHSLGDGFESLELAWSINSGWSCDALKDERVADPMNLEQQVTKATLAAIESAQFKVQRLSTHKEQFLRGTDFWIEGTGGEFGQYGAKGNSFGSTELEDESGEMLSAAPDQFLSFKSEQVRRAVRATILAILWQLDWET